jgi:hypothetical protein
MTLLNDMHEDWNPKDNDVRPAIATLHTDGLGYWSDRAAAVRITELSVPYIDEGEDFGELRVHFNTDDWRPDKHGLIYSDDLFKKELKEYLTSVGLVSADVSYSEQGMQGDNMVSCDVGGEFLKSWKEKFPEAYKTTHNECKKALEDDEWDNMEPLFPNGVPGVSK